MRIARLLGVVEDGDAMEGLIADTGELVDEALDNLDAE
jgi:hypothetical protein